jgi:hypothetical protein
VSVVVGIEAQLEETLGIDFLVRFLVMLVMCRRFVGVFVACVG